MKPKIGDKYYEAVVSHVYPKPRILIVEHTVVGGTAEESGQHNPGRFSAWGRHKTKRGAMCAAVKALLRRAYTKYEAEYSYNKLLIQAAEEWLQETEADR